LGLLSVATSVLHQRAVRHYEGLGWTIEPDAVLAIGSETFRPDLLVAKAGKRRAVRISDDPVGIYEIGALAARSKRAGVMATVICPGTPEVLEACEEFRVEHLSPDGLGEGIVVRAPVRAVATVPAPVVSLTPAAARAVVVVGEIPRWRWAIVAAVWSAALCVSMLLLWRIAS
jgi:hypothetical protein